MRNKWQITVCWYEEHTNPKNDKIFYEELGCPDFNDIMDTITKSEFCGDARLLSFWAREE